MKFEAGTPGIVQTIGLGVALEYMMSIGMENIAAHEAGTRLCTFQTGSVEFLAPTGPHGGQGRDLQLYLRRGRAPARYLDHLG